MTAPREPTVFPDHIMRELFGAATRFREEAVTTIPTTYHDGVPCMLISMSIGQRLAAAALAAGEHMPIDWRPR